MPAASAASIPTAASSTTAQTPGGTPNISAAFKKRSGAGLGRPALYPSATASSSPPMPRADSTLLAFLLAEPMAILIPAAWSSWSSDNTPGSKSAGVTCFNMAT